MYNDLVKWVIKMKTKDIKQKVIFKATSHDIYETLMDEKKHAEFTGGEVKIDKRVDGKFEIWGGSLHGTTTDLDYDTKIVQDWRADEECWPKDHFSKVTFELKEISSGKTELIFTQTGVPEECYESISAGWEDYYWKAMKRVLEE